MADTQRYLMNQGIGHGDASLYSFADVALQDAQGGQDQLDVNSHNLSPFSVANNDAFFRPSNEAPGLNIFSPGIPASPSILGLSSVSWFDEYSSDPRFVESQRELRSLLFTSAQSLAPTRAASPASQDGTHGEEVPRSPNVAPSSSSCMRDIVTTGKRVIWLQNYIQEVAPWVKHESKLSPTRSDFR